MKRKISTSNKRTPKPAVVRKRIEREVSTPISTAQVMSRELRTNPTHFGRMSRVAATLLILFFIFVPVADAYADTESLPSETPTEVVVAEEVPAEEAVDEETIEVVEEPAAIVEEIIEVVPVVTEEGVPSVAPSTDEEVSTDSNATSTLVEEVATSTEIELPVETIVETSTSTSGGGDTGTTTLPVEEVILGTTTPEVVTPVVPEVVPEVVATTTEEVVATTTEEALPTDAPMVVTHSTDADRFAFTTTECVPLGNGAFHCVRATDQALPGDDRGDLYSARDSGGDLEIYMNDGNTDAQLTDNEYDDDAPSYDTETGDVVWHSLMDDRYQIVAYERASGATTRITKESYNSMQPAIYDGDIVFQSWIGNDWEIVFVGKADGKVVLTDNETHDIAPSINSQYIMWQAFEGTEWVAKVYDRTTKAIETVRGLEGGKVENPRMVMVFDSKKENGDVETVGYDPVSGEVTGLAVTPVPSAPKNIPEPEHQQEEKALIQSVTSVKTETKVATSTSDGDDEVALPPILDSLATSTPPVATSTVSEVAVEVEVEDEVEVVLPTVDMTEPVATSTSSLPQLPDLVIPAFNRSTDEATTTPS